MQDTYLTMLENVKEALRQRAYYKSTLDLCEYDMWQTLPPDGQAYRGEMASFLAKEARSLLLSPQTRDTVDYFRTMPEERFREHLDYAAARRLIAEYDRAVKVPAALEGAYARCTLDCQMLWREALKQSDFDMYMPHMKQLFDLKRELALALNPDANPFQTMVNLFDEGLDVEQVRRLFDQVKTAIPALMARTREAVYEPEILSGIPDHARATRLAARLMEATGFDTQKSSFGEILHPICFNIGPRDVRVTINFQRDIWRLICIYLHECGHGRYMYNTDEERTAYSLWGGISGAMHEGIARFYENMIGRSREFVSFIYPFVIEEFPELSRFSPETVYDTLCHVEPGPHRGDADELSYSLHPIIRFEMEYAYYAGDIRMEDFREVWNAKYKEYLGVVPKSDAEGVLNNLSWSSGYLGYYQSYALGNLYGAQLREQLLSDVPDVYASIRKGNFSPLNNWFVENIFRYGSEYTAGETIERVTGSPLQADSFIRYLAQKFC